MTNTMLGAILLIPFMALVLAGLAEPLMDYVHNFGWERVLKNIGAFILFMVILAWFLIGLVLVTSGK